MSKRITIIGCIFFSFFIVIHHLRNSIIKTIFIVNIFEFSLFFFFSSFFTLHLLFDEINLLSDEKAEFHEDNLRFWLIDEELVDGTDNFI